MVVLGLILVAAAVVAIIEGILANTGVVTVHMWGWTWHFELFWAMVCGIGIAVAAILGLWLMSAGGARAFRVRRENRALARENARLAAVAEQQNAAQRAAERDAAGNAAARREAENRAAAKPTVVATPAEGAVPRHEEVAPVAETPAQARADGSYDGTREHQSALGRVLHRR